MSIKVPTKLDAQLCLRENVVDTVYTVYQQFLRTRQEWWSSTKNWLNSNSTNFTVGIYVKSTLFQWLLMKLK